MANPTTDGYPAFKVAPRAASFQGYGMGSYCYFDQGVPIHASNAFVVPVTAGVGRHDILTRFLNGSGGIDHVVDGTGAPSARPSLARPTWSATRKRPPGQGAG